MKTNFWDLLRQSVIVSGCIALATVGAIVYLAVSGRSIPEPLNNMALIVISFFFGSKSVTGATTASNR